MKPLVLIARCAALIMLALLVAAAQKPPAPAVAALQLSDPTSIHIEGELKSKSPDVWIVGDFSVLVDGQTQIIEKRGLAEPGAWLIVWAEGDPSGTPWAEVIVVDRPASASNPRVQFTDVLDKIAGEWWVVGDYLVHVAASVPISGAPSAGSLITVTAEQQDDNLEAIRIETAVQNQSPVPLDFEGKIEAMEKNRWKVDGRWVDISPDTQRIGTPGLNKHAEVRVLQQPSGSLLATVINIPATLEVTMGTLVSDIAADGSGTEVWDVSVFPDQPYTDPYSATVRVDVDTLVDESRAVVGPGQWADVLAKPITSGDFQAEVIRVEQTVPITVTGDLHQAATASGAAGGWAKVGGHTVWFPGRMAGNVAAATGGEGSTLIEGVLLGNGIVWAQRVRPN